MTVIVVDSAGKRAVAKSGFVQPMLEAGFAVLAVDLRGRGETLGVVQPGWDMNYRLVANQVLFGQPLAGRRAFDLMRTIDYARTRAELVRDEFTVIGLNDDALTGRVDAGDYVSDFGDVIPSALKTADLPDVLALIAPRRVLFCRPPDAVADGTKTLAARFLQVTGSAGKQWIRYEPDRALDAVLFLDWLADGAERKR